MQELAISVKVVVKRLCLGGTDLSSFRFVVDSQEQQFISWVPHEVEAKFNKMEKALKYTYGEGIQEEVTTALKYANAFFLDHHCSVKNLSKFGLENISNLKFCCLAGCSEFQTIVGAEVQSHQGDEDEGDINDSSEIRLDFHVEVVVGASEYLCVHYMKS